MPTDLVTLAALLAVLFVLGYYGLRGIIRIVVRGAVLLAVVLLAAHVLSGDELTVLEPVFSYLREHVPLPPLGE